MLKTIRKRLLMLFATQEKLRERAMKDLLRENLSLVAVDIFYIDDPKTEVPPDKLVDYYRKFYDVVRDKDVMERIKYMINKQVRVTVENSKNGENDALGGININGMATIKDDFTKMANLYLQEVPTAETFNKYNVI